MPRRTPGSGWVPPLYHDKAHNRGRVRFPGEPDVGCGRWPAEQRDAPAAVRKRYEELVAEWKARGYEPPPPPKRGAIISDLVAAFLIWAESNYRRRDGRPDSEWHCYQSLIPLLLDACGGLPVADFGPAEMVALQKRFLGVRWKNKVTARGGSWSRGYINEQIARVRRVLNWGVGQGLVPLATAQSIGKEYVRPLKKGKTTAGDRPKRRVPCREEVWLTAAALHKPLRTLVCVHWLIGCRANQIVTLRGREIDREGDVWVWRPSVDKLENRDEGQEEAEYWIGPQAQALLLPLLDSTAADSWLFPVDGRGRQQFGPGGVGAYTKDSYHTAIQRAIRRMRRAGVGPSFWSVGTVRHGRATEIRAAENLAGRHGREAAGAVLGHEETETAIRYANRTEIAQRVQREMG